MTNALLLQYKNTLKGSVLNKDDAIVFQTEVSESGHGEVESACRLDSSDLVVAEVDVIEERKLCHLSRYFGQPIALHFEMSKRTHPRPCDHRFQNIIRPGVV